MNCDRCHKPTYAYYIKSLLTKGVWVCCKRCGTHCAPFKEGLDIPTKESKTYKKTMAQKQNVSIFNSSTW